MKRTALVIMVVALAMQLTTAGLSAKQGVIQDNVQIVLLEQPINYRGVGCNSALYKTSVSGLLCVHTEFTPGTAPAVEQLAVMDGVSGHQAVSARTFKLGGVSQMTGNVICNDLIQPARCTINSSGWFSLRESSAKAAYTVRLDLEIVFSGDVVSSRSVELVAENLCPLE